MVNDMFFFWRGFCLVFVFFVVISTALCFSALVVQDLCLFLVLSVFSCSTSVDAGRRVQMSVHQSSCLAFPSISFVVGNKLSSNTCTRTLCNHGSGVEIVADQRAQDVDSRLASEGKAVTLEDSER